MDVSVGEGRIGVRDCVCRVCVCVSECELSADGQSQTNQAVY